MTTSKTQAQIDWELASTEQAIHKLHSPQLGWITDANETRRWEGEALQSQSRDDLSDALARRLIKNGCGYGSNG